MDRHLINTSSRKSFVNFSVRYNVQSTKTKTFKLDLKDVSLVFTDL